MKILADFHHDDLFQSLRLMGKRLGAEIYRPVGMEWFKGTMWHIHTAEDVGRQFLLPESFSQFPGLTLEEALDTKLDAVIVSHINNFQPWRMAFGDKCPVILQVGNNWAYEHKSFDGVKYVLNSTSTQWPNADVHVRYHPEFKVEKPLDHISKVVRSFVHCPTPEAKQIFGELAEKLGPEWDCRMYGAGSDNGPLEQKEMTKAINECGFVFQHKKGGDGYGFTIHRAWAHNKPVIMDYNHYADKMAAMCMVDASSSFDLNVGVDLVADYVKAVQDVQNHRFKPEKIWEANCHPFCQWQERLKPFWEKVIR